MSNESDLFDSSRPQNSETDLKIPKKYVSEYSSLREKRTRSPPRHSKSPYYNRNERNFRSYRYPKSPNPSSHSPSPPPYNNLRSRSYSPDDYDYRQNNNRNRYYNDSRDSPHSFRHRRYRSQSQSSSPPREYSPDSYSPKNKEHNNKNFEKQRERTYHRSYPKHDTTRDTRNNRYNSSKHAHTRSKKYDYRKSSPSPKFIPQVSVQQMKNWGAELAKLRQTK